MLQRWLFFLLLPLLLAACERHHPSVPRPAPSVYFWRTTLSLDGCERDFLRHYRVKKMYVRFFDVALDADARPMPVATLQFAQSLPDGLEVVPVVFITEPCLRHAPKDFATKVAKRVLQMVETHGVRGVREIQIDCDWTERSQAAYFDFLEKVREHLRESGVGLSATIRLHQLSMTPPPVDYGVLMLYNTADPTHPTGRNPILDHRDVRPYERYLPTYDLPLCAAYPDFRWNRLVGEGRFKGFLYDANLSDSTLFLPLNDRTYLVRQSRYVSTYVGSTAQSDVHLHVGDTIFVHESEPQEIFAVKARLSRLRPELHRQVILYPLDRRNIVRHKPANYRHIFHP